MMDVYTARLHPDGKRVLVIGLDPWAGAWFMIGDVETGETLLRYPLRSPFGETAISEDGLLAVVTDPPPALVMEGINGSGPAFFDLANLRHLKTLNESTGQYVGMPGQARFLPGDREIALGPIADGSTESILYIVDRATLTVNRRLRLPDSEPITGALGVGPRP